MAQWETGGWGLASRSVTIQSAVRRVSSNGYFTGCLTQVKVQGDTGLCGMSSFSGARVQFTACKEWGHSSFHGAFLHWTWVAHAQLPIDEEAKSRISSRKPGYHMPTLASCETALQACSWIHGSPLPPGTVAREQFTALSFCEGKYGHLSVLIRLL